MHTHIVHVHAYTHCVFADECFRSVMVMMLDSIESIVGEPSIDAFYTNCYALIHASPHANTSTVERLEEINDLARVHALRNDQSI